jgi:hypothetical protein
MNAALPRHEILMRQMIEVTPIRVGSRVTVSPAAQYAAEWPAEYVVVSMVWEYQDGSGHEINVGIASDDEIINRHGWTDGFSVDDLIVVRL